MSRWKEKVSDIEVQQSNIEVTNTEIHNIIQCQRQNIASIREVTDKLKLVFRNLTNEIDSMRIIEPETDTLKYEGKDDVKDTAVCLQRQNDMLLQSWRKDLKHKKDFGKPGDINI